MTEAQGTGGAAAPGSAPDAPAVTPPGAARGAPFAHRSEAEFARILDFYDVRWEYEPQVFPILWSLDGVVQESFAPDFYLPDLDLYVELTTLRQRLVRKKNRKLRRLRELYPDIRIKLFYERDFRALMLKYGKLAIADELSGTIGQVGAGHDPTAGDGAPASAAVPPIAVSPTTAPPLAASPAAPRAETPSAPAAAPPTPPAPAAAPPIAASPAAARPAVPPAKRPTAASGSPPAAPTPGSTPPRRTRRIHEASPR